ncbi:uncharacterized protein LOC127798047 [Diospyros lotus]|uniref:uncharacterized protein LOC127798047 n=1 Tax=Diospyros lotus TaxID=55363 RepID=UPI00224C9FC3|nr:uncharacterized protein LOC127798047 [Diospyros lotus]
MEDDSFRARVEKAFGPLASSSSRSPSWSLTDGEVEKREWRRHAAPSARDDDDLTPCSSSFRALFSNKSRFNRRKFEQDLDDDDDDDDDGPSRGRSRPSDDGTDDWDIRSSIGLDRTLDNEAKEDEYDKVAEGREDAGERLYMKDVANHGPYLNSHNLLPGSVHDTTKDPRANHFAARIRLKEDEIEACTFGSNQMNDESMPKVEEIVMQPSEDVGKLRPILKRKDNSATSKGNKHVRFDPGCKDNYEETLEKSLDFFRDSSSVETVVSGDDCPSARNRPGVPDYLLNPSKYTHYTFDSANEVDDKSNSQAFLDFLKLVNRSNPNEFRSQLEDESADLPKSITFIPRKKGSNAAAPVDRSTGTKPNHGDGSSQSAIPHSIAAQGTEVSVMEDDQETSATDVSASFHKPSRRYRTRTREKSDDSVL